MPFLLMGIAYGGGRLVDRAREPVIRWRYALGAIALLCIPLLVYKYTDFISRDVVGPLLGVHPPLLNVPLPLGVSFMTFTLAAYLMDVYNGKFPPDRAPTTILGYVLFFPHLIAGPILRPYELVPQLERPISARRAHFTVSLAIFTLGLVKKLVFADQIADIVTQVFGQAGSPDAPQAILAIIGFAVQIYCDFSGYTDMAIGLAGMLGVRLPGNFRQPYTARSISDLWRRWHMTLTRFLTDYIYTPISLATMRYAVRTRAGKWPTFLLTVALPLNITFLVSGIWHGAGWNFIMFGAITGLAMSVEFAWRRARMPQLPDTVAWMLTMMTFLASICFFRAGSLGKAADVMLAPFLQDWAEVAPFAQRNLFPILLIAVFAAFHRFDDYRRIRVVVRRARSELTWVAIALGWVLAITVSQGSSGKFVYFDF
ncbi:MAG: MBOAT family protein [Alphaproteobacteria bacterium]|nr:MBOAT family protein [Alphaproteobacteria bacterium]